MAKAEIILGESGGSSDFFSWENNEITSSGWDTHTISYNIADINKITVEGYYYVGYETAKTTQTFDLTQDVTTITLTYTYSSYTDSRIVVVDKTNRTVTFQNGKNNIGNEDAKAAIPLWFCVFKI